MKIRFLMHRVYGGGGGVLTVVRNLAAELAVRHEVEIVSVLREADEPVHPLPAGVAVRPLTDVRPSRTAGVTGGLRRAAHHQRSRLIPATEPHFAHYSLYSDLQLARYLRSVKEGVLVGMQPGVNIAVARLGRPSVVRIGQDHRPFVTRKDQLMREQQARLPSLDMFLTLTETDAERYRRAFSSGPPPVRVMPNATPAYDGPLSRLDHRVVTAAGHLTRDKGFDRLIEAWALVHRRHPEWELRIFGTGRQQDDLTRQISELGLVGSARLMGYTRTLLEEMAQSSIFVLSSRVEGYGMVVVEAMSCGVPAISFDCPTGPRDIITSGEDGLLVPNGDIPALADAIVTLIEDDAARTRMGAAAVLTARSRSQQEIAGRWEQLFDELLEAKQA